MEQEFFLQRVRRVCIRDIYGSYYDKKVKIYDLKVH